MAIPVQLEIFMKDLTKAGLQSVGKNVDDVENQTLQLISALKQVIAEQKHQLEVNKTAGISYTQEAANIQALTGQVRGLEAGLKELKKTKEETAKTQPIDIDTEAVTRKTNNLKMQFSQVARELPSLAMGPQMFILAISNNLPMLADAISDVRKQNELLAASGQKGVPVWKQLASSVFSWQTALVAAISLGIVFGKDIMDWVSKITKGKDAALSLADAQKKVNEAFEKDSGNVGEQTVRIRSLSEQWKKLGDNLEDKKRFIKENKDELDKLGVSVGNVNDAENLLAKNTEQYIQAMSLRAQAASAFKLATEAAETAIKKQVQINQEEKKSPSFMDRFLSVLSGTGASSTWSSRSTEEATAEQRQQTRINGMKEEKKAAEETEKAYTELFTTLSNQAKKVLNDAGISESDNKEETKIAKTDYASQLADARVKAQQTTEKLRLQIMLEGIAKRKALAKQEYDDTISEIDKEERDTLAKMDKARKQGDNIPQSQYDSVKQEAQTQRILAQQVYNEQIFQIEKEYQDKSSQSLIDYYKEYGTYQEKKLAIAQDYARKIAAAETEGEVKTLTRQRDDKLASLDFEEMKKGMDWEKIFGDLDKVSTDTLEKLREKLKQYLEGIGDDISPESFKEVMDAFNNLDVELADRSPFETLKSGYKDYKAAMQEVEAAQNLLKQAQMAGTVIVEEYNEGTGELTRELITQAEAEERLRNAQDKRYNAQKTLTQAVNSIGQKGEAVVNAGNDLVDMLTSLGVKVPEDLQGVLGGLGTITSSLASIDFTKPFSALTGITGILKGIGQTIGGIMGFGGADYSGYEEMKSRYEGLIDIWDTLIDKKTEYIDIDYGTEAQKAAEEAIKLTETQIERQRQLANMLASSGASVGSHSLGYRVNDRMSSQDWQRLSGLVGQQVDSLDDVLKLDADVIGKVLQDEKFVNVLTTVNSDFIEYIQNIEKYGEQLEEIANKEQEAITGIGFDAFRDGYIDMLADLSSSNEDFADNFEKQLQNAIFRSLIANKYTSQIQNLYDEWVRLGEDGLTKSEVEYLRNLQQNLTDKLVQERENMKDLFGWKSEDKESTDTAIEGLEELQKAYEKLSEASSKAFSSEAVKILKQQNENLNEQMSLIRKRIDEENRSANPDTDYLDELKGQLEDVNAQIEDNKEAMKDAIFGEDIQSAISNFVSAYTEALGNGGSMQKMSKDFVESMVQNMVTESMKADASPVMENIREKLIEAWKDGVITADEQLSIEEIVNSLNKELSDKYGWTEGLFGESDIEGLEALQDAYDKLSDSVSEAYSSEKSELLKQQSEILRQQRDLILERLEAEKALGERGDASLVNEWEEQLEEVNSKIEENKKSQLDAIFGQETQTQISNLANALIDVWSGAKKQADSAKDFINNIIRSMVLESLMLDLTPFIDSLREQMAEMFEDGIISADEGDALAGMVEGVMNSLEKQYEWADRFMKDSEEIAQELEEMKQSLTGLTLDSFTDSFVSGLADMSKSYKDMCDDFEDSLRNSIFKGLVESQYKNRITALYNMWERAAESEGQITDKEAEQLRYEYQQIIQDLMKQRDEMAQDFGWANTTDQSPSSGALTTMSQDSIAAFEGIGRNMQTHLANMDRYVQELRETQRLDSETLATIASHTAYIVLIYDLMEDMKLNGIKMQ
ncbi:hypothetical protein [Phocaeicola barnesiae]|uniref:hypothetical protein n=1 Tax=Phocaeicola barnesiae TaxID=376804 RepID=UPI0025A39E6C|nr:hypothetical protein [Phocaeicola barnesiae]MDM8253364.1 hypothetical protein [Phocaeicola barnesiae]